MEELFQGDLVYCPLCEQQFMRSSYLSTVFPAGSGPLWFANMVMHYRHHHVVYYNHSVHYNSWHGRYEAFKSEVNERAKRQILRGAKRFLREHGFTADDLDELQGTTGKTRALALKLLGGSPEPRRTVPNRGPMMGTDDGAHKTGTSDITVAGELVSVHSMSGSSERMRSRETEQLRLDRFLSVEQ
jgi:hypothetical protein